MVVCIVLTTSSAYTPPTGACLTESPRATGGVDKVLAKPKLSEYQRQHERRLTALNTQPCGHVWLYPQGTSCDKGAAEYNGLAPTTVVTKTYYFAGAQLVAMREITSTGSTLYFMHQDHLGSSSLTTNSSGAVVARQAYYAYGNVRPGGGIYFFLGAL